ncbi:glycosyltransferase family 2 protein [Swingsia samuiensis]|nr:glycosyltransferase [Swingsia samuiensis]
MNFKDSILASPSFSGERHPAWGKFDPQWYKEKYGRQIQNDDFLPEGKKISDLSDEDFERHWLEYGALKGFSPNYYFDEEWYRRQNSDVRNGIEVGIFNCGYLHYCEIGYPSRAPHWLFSDKEYFRRNSDLSIHKLRSSGFVNGYDHYLRQGVKEQRQASIFFNPIIFRNACWEQNLPYDFDKGDLEQFLDSEEMGGSRTSWYFDPVWYLEKYPDVAVAIKEGRFLNPLHHYLTNSTPTAYDPNQWFSEQFYAQTYPDIASTVENGGFRNGYEHFIRFGVHEFRAPHSDVDLKAFAEDIEIQKEVNKKKFDDVFALWVSNQNNGKDKNKAITTSSDEYYKLSELKSISLLPSLIRSPLDFRLIKAPVISVVIPVDNQFSELMLSLVSLHENNFGDLEVILVDNGSTDELEDIHRVTKGVRVYKNHYSVRDKDRINKVLQGVQAPHVLFMLPGTQFFPETLKKTLKHFSAEGVFAVGGQCLGLDARVVEAGTIVWRDGSSIAFGRGMRANDSTINFSRHVDAITHGGLLIRADKIKELSGLDENLIGYEAQFLSLCLGLREKGGKIVYDPALLTRVQREMFFPSDFKARNELYLRRRFPALLSRHLWVGSNIFKARFSSQNENILFVCGQFPKNMGGGVNLYNYELIRNLSDLGYNVTILSLRKEIMDDIDIALDFPNNIELILDTGIDGLSGFLSERSGSFDYVWVSEIQTLDRIKPILENNIQHIPSLSMILSVNGSKAEEVYYRKKTGCVDDKQQEVEDLKQELSNAYLCQMITASYHEETDNIKRAGYGNVIYLMPPVKEYLTKDFLSFDEREGVLFNLPINESGDAVHDGLDWFINHVLPILDKKLPNNVLVTLAADCDPSIDLTAYTQHSRVELFWGDSRELYRTKRVFIDPTRVSSKIVFENIIAAKEGLPAVIGETSCSQIGWIDGKQCLNGGFSDPQRFAEAIIKLYTNKNLWEDISDTVQKFIQDPPYKAHFKEHVQHILSLARGEGEVPVSPYAFETHNLKKEVKLSPTPLRVRPRKTMDTVLPEIQSVNDENEVSLEENETFAPRIGIEIPE